MNINCQRAVARRFLSLSLAPLLTVFCAIFCASLISAPVAAQDTQSPTSASIQTQDIVARPIPERTVGLESGKVVKWTLKDAILAALENNVDIQLEQENVRFVQYDLIAAQGFYDPTATSRIQFNKNIIPNVGRFTGSDDDTISADTLTYNFGASKNFERGGGLLFANFNNQRQVSNSSNLATSYSPGMSFQFNQPLFRNFGIDQARRNIKVTKKQLALNDAQYRARVIQIILAVEQAYWDLSLAIKNEEVRRESVKLAETFLNNTKRQVEVGTLAPIEVVFAATQLEQRRQDVFQAMNNVGMAENALKNLTVGGSKDELWSSMIVPIQSFDNKQVSIPIQDAIKLAHDNRPEIRQLGLSEEINKIDVEFLRNQVKPQIDLIANYSTNGAAGTPAVLTGVAPNCNNPDMSVPGGVCNSIVVGRDAAGNFIPTVRTIPFDPATPFRQESPIADQFIGGYGTALGNMFRNKYRTWSVGIQFSLPLRNRVAKAQLGKALESKRQIDLQTRQLMQNIEVEVRNAVQSVEMSKMRIDAAEAATRYARQQLDGEEKKFAAGMAAGFFVLQRQNELSLTQISELQAKADYNKALANLHRVMSTTLSNNSIELKQDAPVTIK